MTLGPLDPLPDQGGLFFVPNFRGPVAVCIFFSFPPEGVVSFVERPGHHWVETDPVSVFDTLAMVLVDLISRFVLIYLFTP